MLAFIKTIIKSNANELGRPVAFAACLIVLMSMCTVFGPLALRETVNGLASQKYDFALGGVVAYVALGFLSRLLSASLIANFGRVWRRLNRYITHLSYLNILSNGSSFYNDKSFGGIKQVVDSGISGFRAIASSLYFTVAPVVVQIIFITGVLSQTMPFYVAVILFIFSCLCGVKFYTDNLPQRRLHQSAMIADLAVASITSDVLLNNETISVFKCSTWALERLEGALKKSENDWTTFFRAQGRHQIFTAILIALVWLLLLYISVHLVATGSATAGDFILVNSYVMQVLGPIERLASGAREANQGLSYIEALIRLFGKIQFCDEMPGTMLLSRSAPAETSENIGAELRFTCVQFHYKQEAALIENLDFTVSPGKTAALVGPSGSGKSTIARLAVGLYQVSSGSVTVNGRPISETSHLRDRIALVPQEISLFNTTILDNLSLGDAELSLLDIESVIDQAGLRETIRALPNGLRTVVGERGARLSGGERQRIALARALLRRPKLLVLDEATSSLDGATERFLSAQSFFRDKGLSRLIVAHRLHTIQHAEEILVIKAGRVVERGVHSTLMDLRGEYFGLWQKQADSTEPAN